MAKRKRRAVTRQPTAQTAPAGRPEDFAEWMVYTEGGGDLNFEAWLVDKPEAPALPWGEVDMSNWLSAKGAGELWDVSTTVAGKMMQDTSLFAQGGASPQVGQKDVERGAWEGPGGGWFIDPAKAAAFDTQQWIYIEGKTYKEGDKIPGDVVAEFLGIEGQTLRTLDSELGQAQLPGADHMKSLQVDAGDLIEWIESPDLPRYIHTNLSERLESPGEAGFQLYDPTIEGPAGAQITTLGGIKSDTVQPEPMPTTMGAIKGTATQAAPGATITKTRRDISAEASEEETEKRRAEQLEKTSVIAERLDVSPATINAAMEKYKNAGERPLDPSRYASKDHPDIQNRRASGNAYYESDVIDALERFPTKKPALAQENPSIPGVMDMFGFERDAKDKHDQDVREYVEGLIFDKDKNPNGILIPIRNSAGSLTGVTGDSLTDYIESVGSPMAEMQREKPADGAPVEWEITDLIHGLIQTEIDQKNAYEEAEEAKWGTASAIYDTFKDLIPGLTAEDVKGLSEHQRIDEFGAPVERRGAELYNIEGVLSVLGETGMPNTESAAQTAYHLGFSATEFKNVVEGLSEQELSQFRTANPPDAQSPFSYDMDYAVANYDRFIDILEPPAGITKGAFIAKQSGDLPGQIARGQRMSDEEFEALTAKGGPLEGAEIKEGTFLITPAMEEAYEKTVVAPERKPLTKGQVVGKGSTYRLTDEEFTALTVTGGVFEDAEVTEGVFKITPEMQVAYEGTVEYKQRAAFMLLDTPTYGVQPIMGTKDFDAHLEEAYGMDKPEREKFKAQYREEVSVPEGRQASTPTVQAGLVGTGLQWPTADLATAVEAWDTEQDAIATDAAQWGSASAVAGGLLPGTPKQLFSGTSITKARKAGTFNDPETGEIDPNLVREVYSADGELLKTEYKIDAIMAMFDPQTKQFYSEKDVELGNIPDSYTRSEIEDAKRRELVDAGTDESQIDEKVESFMYTFDRSSSVKKSEDVFGTTRYEFTEGPFALPKPLPLRTLEEVEETGGYPIPDSFDDFIPPTGEEPGSFLETLPDTWMASASGEVGPMPAGEAVDPKEGVRWTYYDALEYATTPKKEGGLGMRHDSATRWLKTYEDAGQLETVDGRELWKTDSSVSQGLAAIGWFKEDITARSVEVIDIIDGDTVLLSNNQSIRIKGLDAPERGERGFEESRALVGEFLGLMEDEELDLIGVEYIAKRKEDPLASGRPIADLKAGGVEFSDYFKRNYKGPASTDTTDTDVLFDTWRDAVASQKWGVAHNIEKNIDALGLSADEYHDRGYAAPGEAVESGSKNPYDWFSQDLMSMEQYQRAQAIFFYDKQYNEAIGKTGLVAEQQAAEAKDVLDSYGLNATTMTKNQVAPGIGGEFVDWLTGRFVPAVDAVGEAVAGAVLSSEAGAAVAGALVPGRTKEDFLAGGPVDALQGDPKGASEAFRARKYIEDPTFYTDSLSGTGEGLDVVKNGEVVASVEMWVDAVKQGKAGAVAKAQIEQAWTDNGVPYSARFDRMTEEQNEYVRNELGAFSETWNDTAGIYENIANTVASNKDWAQQPLKDVGWPLIPAIPSIDAAEDIRAGRYDIGVEARDLAVDMAFWLTLPAAIAINKAYKARTGKSLLPIGKITRNIWMNIAQIGFIENILATKHGRDAVNQFSREMNVITANYRENYVLSDDQMSTLDKMTDDPWFATIYDEAEQVRADAGKAGINLADPSGTNKIVGDVIDADNAAINWIDAHPNEDLPQEFIDRMARADVAAGDAGLSDVYLDHKRIGAGLDPVREVVDLPGVGAIDTSALGISPTASVTDLSSPTVQARIRDAVAAFDKGFDSLEDAQASLKALQGRYATIKDAAYGPTQDKLLKETGAEIARVKKTIADWGKPGEGLAIDTQQQLAFEADQITGQTITGEDATIAEDIIADPDLFDVGTSAQDLRTKIDSGVRVDWEDVANISEVEATAAGFNPGEITSIREVKLFENLTPEQKWYRGEMAKAKRGGWSPDWVPESEKGAYWAQFDQPGFDVPESAMTNYRMQAALDVTAVTPGVPGVGAKAAGEIDTARILKEANFSGAKNMDEAVDIARLGGMSDEGVAVVRKFGKVDNLVKFIKGMPDPADFAFAISEGVVDEFMATGRFVADQEELLASGQLPHDWIELTHEELSWAMQSDLITPDEVAEFQMAAWAEQTGDIIPQYDLGRIGGVDTVSDPATYAIRVPKKEGIFPLFPSALDKRLYNLGNAVQDRRDAFADARTTLVESRGPDVRAELSAGTKWIIGDPPAVLDPQARPTTVGYGPPSEIEYVPIDGGLATASIPSPTIPPAAGIAPITPVIEAGEFVHDYTAPDLTPQITQITPRGADPGVKAGAPAVAAGQVTLGLTGDMAAGVTLEGVDFDTGIGAGRPTPELPAGPVAGSLPGAGTSVSPEELTKVMGSLEGERATQEAAQLSGAQADIYAMLTPAPPPTSGEIAIQNVALSGVGIPQPSATPSIAPTKQRRVVDVDAAQEAAHIARIEAFNVETAQAKAYEEARLADIARGQATLPDLTKLGG